MINDKKIKRLLDQLEHDDPAKRYEAVLLLGKTGNTELMAPLDKVASLDDDERVRRLAIKAVQALKVLLVREEELALKTQQADEGELSWNLMAARLGESDDQNVKSGSFSYEESRKTQDFEAFELEEEEKSKTDKKSAKKTTSDSGGKQRSRRYWLLLRLSAIVGVLALVIVAYDALQEEEDIISAPQTEGIRLWAQESRTLAEAYNAAFDGTTLNCEALSPNVLPSVSPSPILENPEEYPEFVALVETIENDFATLQRDVEGLCRDSDMEREVPSTLQSRLAGRINDLMQNTQKAVRSQQ